MSFLKLFISSCIDLLLVMLSCDLKRAKFHSLDAKGQEKNMWTTDSSSPQ